MCPSSRDDIENPPAADGLCQTALPSTVAGKIVVLVDDVLYTGRTVVRAIEALVDFGAPGRCSGSPHRPGHRDLPIRADYIGKNLPTSSRRRWTSG